MEEFKIAHLEMVKGQKKYLVPILKEEIDIDSLPSDQRDLQMYLRTYTYIDGTEQQKILKGKTYIDIYLWKIRNSPGNSTVTTLKPCVPCVPRNSSVDPQIT